MLPCHKLCLLRSHAHRDGACAVEHCRHRKSQDVSEKPPSLVMQLLVSMRGRKPQASNCKQKQNKAAATPRLDGVVTSRTPDNEAATTVDGVAPHGHKHRSGMRIL